MSLTVDSSQKVLLMGRSKDLAVCHSMTKAGRQCTNFINMYVNDFFSVVLLVCTCLYIYTLVSIMYRLFVLFSVGESTEGN